MQRCFELALGGNGFVAPNPLVGAVFVHENKIISEGYHQKFGGLHAEAEALKNIHDRKVLSAGTLYVNLEPCSHFGKTPPCAKLIIEKGIKKVVISNTDPNPIVKGNGIAMLKNAGIEVTQGVLEKEGEILNRRFFTFHNKKRPYIILKWAATADGFIAPTVNSGKISWISNKSSKLLVHKWRDEEQGILVGRKTVEADNPQLTTRHFGKKNPVRMVIDSSLKLKSDYHVFNSKARTLIFNSVKTGQKHNAELIKLKKGKSFLKDLLKYLHSENIQSLIVEGGAKTLHNFIEAGLWDEARVFTGENFLGSGVKAPEFNFVPVEQQIIDGDQLSFFMNKQSVAL